MNNINLIDNDDDDFIKIPYNEKNKILKKIV